MIRRPPRSTLFPYTPLSRSASRRGRDGPAATAYEALAARAATSFHARFWRPELGYLADVVDTPDGADDLTLRPNQLLAVSLPYELLETAQARAVVEAVGRELVTSYGLRSLPPGDPR